MACLENLVIAFLVTVSVQLPFAGLDRRVIKVNLFGLPAMREYGIFGYLGYLSAGELLQLEGRSIDKLH